jgi:hypothetical protein
MPTRRHILKSALATIALPFLPSLVHSDDGPAAAAAANAARPLRYAACIFANGVRPGAWAPRQGADGLELPGILAPLAPHRRRIVTTAGLRLFEEVSHGSHNFIFTNLLSGGWIERSNVPRLAQSLDQALAAGPGRATAIPSLVLGTESAETGIRLGVPAIYYATVSWGSPTTPIPPETDPARAFDRLFDVHGLERDRSVLDAVMAQTADVRRDLGRRDRDRLDQYLGSLREIEQRIARAADSPLPDAALLAARRPSADRAWRLDERQQAMLDLLVLAFQTDRTRVATLLFEKDVSDARFDFLEGVPAMAHHAISHHQDKPETLAAYERINAHHIGLFARFLDALAAIPDGDADLLERCCLLFGSNMHDGNGHDPYDLPLVIAGGCNGRLRGNRHLAFTDVRERRLCNLHLATAQLFGLPGPAFGNSHMPLPGLFA